MEARCKKCDHRISMRNQRGNKLSDLTCKCGGKFERMNNTGKIYGESPMELLSPTIKPFESWPDQRVYYHTFLNGKGEHFFVDYENSKFVKHP